MIRKAVDEETPGWNAEDQTISFRVILCLACGHSDILEVSTGPILDENKCSNCGDVSVPWRAK